MQTGRNNKQELFMVHILCCAGQYLLSYKDLYNYQCLPPARMRSSPTTSIYECSIQDRDVSMLTSFCLSSKLHASIFCITTSFTMLPYFRQIEVYQVAWWPRLSAPIHYSVVDWTQRNQRRLPLFLDPQQSHHRIDKFRSSVSQESFDTRTWQKNLLYRAEYCCKPRTLSPRAPEWW